MPTLNPEEPNFAVFHEIISQTTHWDNGVAVGVVEITNCEEVKVVYRKNVWQHSILDYLPGFSYDKRIDRATRKANSVYLALGGRALQDVEPGLSI